MKTNKLSYYQAFFFQFYDVDEVAIIHKTI